MKSTLIISCEHAGNNVPDKYQSLFDSSSEILNSHRGWDPGAWTIASDLAQNIHAPLFGCHTTRLLIEVNRSLTSHQLFSEFSSLLNDEEKQELIREIYLTYRTAVEEAIQRAVKPVLHISMHSFTPVWNEQKRKTDIGLLFDPSRKFEYDVCTKLKGLLEKELPTYTIDFNEPYKGIDDGFTTWLRTQYKDNEYAGIEIEVNQKFTTHLEGIKKALINTIKELI